jgi:purine nucleoside permease
MAEVANSAKGSGGAVKGSISPVDHSVHVLTDAHGRYIALLCRDNGSLIQLGKVARA